MRAGVLALQGAVTEHQRVLESLGAQVELVRTPLQLEGLDVLVLPGGESTAMARLAASSGLMTAIRERVGDGLAVLGTCAGLILLADQVLDAEALDGQQRIGGLDVAVRRNAYGNQLSSGEHPVEMSDTTTMRGVFIRAPRIERVGAGVDVLARRDGLPVVVLQERVVGCAFHPELAGDDRLHRLLLDLVVKG